MRTGGIEFFKYFFIFKMKYNYIISPFPLLPPNPLIYPSDILKVLGFMT